MARSLKDLRNELAAAPVPGQPKAKPKRKRAPKAGSRGGETTVYQFPRAGTLLRKTVYFSPAEWQAIQAQRKATGASATEVIRRAVRNELGID